MEGGLRIDHFYDPMCKGCFNFILEYWEENHHTAAPTADAVNYEFPRFTIPDVVEESTEWLVAKIHTRYVRNNLQDAMFDAAEVSTREDQPIEALRKLHIETWSALRSVTPRRGRADISQDVEIRRRRYEERATFDGECAGVPMGLEAVDSHSFGILPGELALVAALSKTGKTFLLAHAAISARRAGYTPYFASLELSVTDMEDRLDAVCSGLPYEKIQKGKLSDDEFKTLIEEQDKFAALGSLFVEKPPKNERTVPFLVNRAWDVGADFLVIDQLSFLESNSQNNYRDGHIRVGDIVNDLKLEISQDDTHAMPTLMAVQINREGAKADKLKLQHMALTSSLEQIADVVYGLSQSDEMKANRSMQLEQLGFRRGASKGWLLAWEFGSRTNISVRQEIGQT